MLTGDHVRASADDGIVTLKKLHGLSAPKVLDLADRLVAALREQRGASLRQLTEAFAAVITTPREVRLKEALVKLLLDASELSDAPAGNMEMRLALFREAAAARSAGSFDREAILATHGVGSSLEDTDRALYSDLPEHRTLVRPSILEGKTLVADFDREQARALLLSARSLTVFLPRGTRALRRLVWRAKFAGLIPEAHERGEEIAVSLEGPAATFAAGRYGLAFANLFPELESLPAYRLEADVHLTRVSHGTFGWHGGTGRTDEDALPARPAVDELARNLAPHFDRIEPADVALLGQRGRLLVPDLTLVRGARRVHLELLDGASFEVARARVEAWPHDARDLIVCYKEPNKVTKQNTLREVPPWLFCYRRTLATKLLLVHAARFFD